MSFWKSVDLCNIITKQEQWYSDRCIQLKEIFFYFNKYDNCLLKNSSFNILLPDKNLYDHG